VLRHGTHGHAQVLSHLLPGRHQAIEIPIILKNSVGHREHREHRVKTKGCRRYWLHPSGALEKHAKPASSLCPL
jgi:hypothetical protein